MNGQDLLEQEAKREDIVAEIHEKFSNIVWPAPILEPIFYGRLNKTEVAGRKLMLDKSNDTQFDIVSNQYELIYHEEVLKKLLDAVPEEFGDPLVDISMFKQGARANFNVKFPELAQFEIKGSETNVEYNLRNSYDRSAYLNFSAGLDELVCSNGLRVFKEKERMGAKHIGQTISSFQLGDKLKNSLEGISESHKIFLQWAEHKISEIEMNSIVESLPYSEKEQEALVALPLLNHGNASLMTLKEDATIWSVYSAGTQMVHELKSGERKLNIEEKLPVIINEQTIKLAA